MKKPLFTSEPKLRRPLEYLIATATSAIIGGICYPISQAIGYQTVGFLFLMGVALLSLLVGRSAVLFAALLSFFAWNFFFIPPIFTFHITLSQDIIALFTYLVVALSSGVLITRIRRNQIILTKSQEKIRTINMLLESLNNADSIRDVIRRASEIVNNQFQAEMIVYLKEKDDNKLDPKAFGSLTLGSESVFANAQAIFDGAATKNGKLHFYPLTIQRGTIGVIGLDFKKNENPDEETIVLLKAFISQITAALDREINIDKAKEKEILMESQKLFQTVLNSVSHELRTPISIISTAVSTLDDENTASNPGTRRQVCDELNSAVKRLNLLVENILDMSKIDSGYLRLNKQLCDASDLFGMALNEVMADFKNHHLKINIAENLPTLKIDIHWFKQALVNILHNAVNYTPPGSEIYLEAYQDEGNLLVIEIMDSGTGVPEHSLKRLFDKFYRVPGSKSGGTGLGLTIAKAIVEAHKGIIFAKNRTGGGLSVFIIMGSPENE